MNQDQQQCLAQNLTGVQRTVEELSIDCAHHPKLLAVSKKQSIAAMRVIYNCGMREFAESFMQEALEKIPQLPMDIVWHYIGKLQSNKLKKTAQNFHWVHTLASIKHAEKLQQYCAEYDKKMQILLQINVDLEEQKSGILLTQIADIDALVVHVVHHCPNLELRGFMCILQENNDYKMQLASFNKLVQLQLRINTKFKLSLDQLSMGMSGDMPAAIAAGTTILRVGTAIFGQRQL